MRPRPLGSVRPPWKRNPHSQLSRTRPFGTATPPSSLPGTPYIEKGQKATPVQLLRFALWGSSQSPEAKRNDSKLDRCLDFIFASPFLSRQHKTLLQPSHFPTTFSLPESEPSSSLSSIALALETQVNSRDDALRMLEALPTIKDVLSRCHTQVQYEELLAMVNATFARLQSLKATPSKDLLLLGIFYASICFSPSALQHYVAQYVEGGHGSLSEEAATNLVKTLLAGIRTRVWADWPLQREQMREVVAGVAVEGADSSPSLHSILGLSGDILGRELAQDYATLLGVLGSVERLSELWDSMPAKLGSDGAPGLLATAVRCLEAFIKAGNTREAVQRARDASQFVDLNKILPVSLWKSLIEHDTSGLLHDVLNEQTAALVLQDQLHLIEISLGTVWSGSQHTKAHDTMSVSNHDQLDELNVYNELGMGEIPASVMIKRLLHGTVINGSSKHMASLSVIADFLNEYEGVEIPLGIHEDLQQEYAWFPQCSPIEFTGYETPVGFDMATPRSTASLGLFRARPDCNGMPLKSGRHLHLMQLGYIASRIPGPREQQNIDSWMRTGHIIGWDRLNQCLVLLWVGKGFGTITPGLSRPTLPASLPYLSAKIEVVESDSGKLNIQSIQPLDNTGAYWLDVDPGFDLQP